MKYLVVELWHFPQIFSLHDIHMLGYGQNSSIESVYIIFVYGRWYITKHKTGIRYVKSYYTTTRNRFRQQRKMNVTFEDRTSN